MRKVIKRDGREVEFDKNKIINAIRKAMKSVDIITMNGLETKIADEIHNLNRAIEVEKIQDIIEEKLMASDYKDVAKAYIIYRNERTKNREKKSELVKKVMVRVNSEVDNHSNANVDEMSFSGREKEASSDIGKTIALDFGGLSNDVANAHKEMLVYQHDLEKAIYGVHNCLNLNFQEIFTNGFHTRNGDVRPPTSFSTACQLVAVAFQCQSQIQFGGVGSIHLDYDLAPFVRMSFSKHFKDGLKYIENANIEYIEHIPSNIDIEDREAKSWSKAYQYAIDMLEKEGQQATQALYHNLNTLESRQGSQVK